MSAGSAVGGGRTVATRPYSAAAIIAALVVAAVHLLPPGVWMAAELLNCRRSPCECRWERYAPPPDQRPCECRWRPSDRAWQCGCRRWPQPEGRVCDAQQPDEEVIEGALLRQGGGGEYDPRTIHRTPPVLAEERAREIAGQRHTDTPTPRDGGVRRDPSAALTERDVRGQGNQDLAERLRRLAASEGASDPTAPPGPGSPDGSVFGTETDPNRAGTGAWAKVQSFLQNNLHLLATAPSTARRTFRLRVIISDDGGYVTRGEIVQGSGDETTDADLIVQLAQLGENRTAIPELTDEERIAIRGQRRIVRYVP